MKKAWAEAFAPVPQDMTYTGRLVDNVGDPLDAMGAFSVQLGLGASSSGGPFDADLFSDVERWLEVVVGAEVLAPRQIIGSVPWALISQQANEIVPDPDGPFKDCGGGTVADPKTGLLWEKKDGTVAGAVNCAITVCPDPHDVNNEYRWSNTGGGRQTARRSPIS